MLNLVLYQPDIPQNLGAMLRLSACLQARVHIVEPCGFPPDDRTLRRAAMDYGALAAPVRHASWAAFLASAERASGRLVLLTTKADDAIWSANFTDADLFVIGQESAGTPAAVRADCAIAVRIPLAPGARSLNAPTAAAIALAEARRQTGWRGGAK